LPLCPAAASATTSWPCSSSPTSSAVRAAGRWRPSATSARPPTPSTSVICAFPTSLLPSYHPVALSSAVPPCQVGMLRCGSGSGCVHSRSVLSVRGGCPPGSASDGCGVFQHVWLHAAWLDANPLGLEPQACAIAGQRRRPAGLHRARPACPPADDAGLLAASPESLLPRSRKPLHTPACRCKHR
jgi:hypothetical protein